MGVALCQANNVAVPSQAAQDALEQQPAATLANVLAAAGRQWDTAGKKENVNLDD